MLRHALALTLLFIMLSGCASQPPAQNSTSQPVPPLQPQQAPPSTTVPAQQWAHYSNLGMSFDYPSGMRVSETADSYPTSATVVVQSSDAAAGAIVIDFVNASLAQNTTLTPEQIAVGILSYDNSSGSDALLSIADGTGAVSNFTSPGGLATAEMRFTLPNGNITLYGVALEMYDKGRFASYPVRVVSSDPNQTQALRDRFVSSFRSG